MSRSASTNRPTFFSAAAACCITHVTLSLSSLARSGGTKRDWRDLDLAFTIDPVLSEYHALAQSSLKCCFFEVKRGDERVLGWRLVG